MNFQGTQQRTLKDSMTLTGVGIHSGKPTRLTLKPARPNSGIRFVRTDLPGSPEIAAHYKNVVNTQMATTLGRGPVTISTVEHVLAALQGMGVDSATIEVDGRFVPSSASVKKSAIAAKEQRDHSYQVTTIQIAGENGDHVFVTNIGGVNANR